MSNSRTASETARVRRLWQKMAAGYDRQIQFFEKVLFAGGREWIGDKAQSDVLEIAIGTGRNIPH